MSQQQRPYSQRCLPLNGLGIWHGVYPQAMSDIIVLVRAMIDPTIKFAQTVSLLSSNLVQITNFTQRCRRERSSGQKREYLVVISGLQPSRDVVRLIEQRERLGVTVLVVGGVCRAGAYRELLPMASVICEWFGERRLFHTHPVISLYTPTITSAQSFSVIVSEAAYRQLVSTPSLDVVRAAEESLHETLMEWQTRRNPRLYFSIQGGSIVSWQDSNRQAKSSSHTYSSSSSSSSSSHQGTKTHAGGEVVRACLLLRISEDESRDAELLKRAYRRLAREHHPDKQHGSGELFAEISTAYTFLTSLL